MHDDPVFVAGLERSGTSLVFALLASHPNISMTRRTNFWRYFVDQYGDLTNDANLDTCLAKMERYKRIVVLDIDFRSLREEFVAGPRTYARLYALLQQQVASRRGKLRWGDKSLNLEQYTERLLADYPRATILHVIRDPRDRLASVLTRWERRRGDVSAGTAAWLWSVGLAERNLAKYPSRYRVVRYESLVQDPEGELRKICAFIDEDFDEAMLTMADAGRFHDHGSNSSYGARERGVISTDSIRKYEKVLSPTQVEFIQRVASKKMIDHDYAIHPIALTATERLKFALGYQPYHRTIMAVWRAQEAYRRGRAEPLPDYRQVPTP
jgi:hypothetical protein